MKPNRLFAQVSTRFFALFLAAFLFSGCTSVAEIRTHHDASDEVIEIDADNPSKDRTRGGLEQAGTLSARLAGRPAPPGARAELAGNDGGQRLSATGLRIKVREGGLTDVLLRDLTVELKVAAGG